MEGSKVMKPGPYIFSGTPGYIMTLDPSLFTSDLSSLHPSSYYEMIFTLVIIVIEE